MKTTYVTLLMALMEQSGDPQIQKNREVKSRLVNHDGTQPQRTIKVEREK